MGDYVLGIGVSAVDIIGKTYGFPEPDGYSLLLEYDRQVGGMVSNALVSLSRLGVPTTWLGKVGDDEFGQVILEDMQREGVGLEVVTDAANPSPLSLIIVDSQTGARSINFRPGCSFSYGADVPPRVLDGAEMIHLDGFFPDAAIQAARFGRGSGTTVSLDAGMKFPELEELLNYVDVFIPNISVARELSGERRPEGCMKKLVELGPRTVVITMGAEGSLGHEDAGTVRVDAVPVEVVDTTGCGDAYHGAFLYGELRGWGLESKMQFAGAYAALKATRLGGRKGLPSLAQMKEFLGDLSVELPID